MPTTRKLLTAAAGSAGGGPLYVEDVFSTFLYNGNSSSPITINNGIDFAGEGGLFWNRDRNTGYTGSVLLDTERGTLQTLATDQTSANVSITANKNVTYNSNGISLQAASSTATGVLNFSGYDLCSWSFRKAEKFFDVVTYTGNSTVGRTVAHNLGVAPAWMVIKCTNAARNWCTYHISLGNGYQIILNNTAVKETTALWNYTTPTATEFTLGNDLDVNGTGKTYVAYLFASDAGGFGDDENENIISCGSYTGNATTPPVINLGWEPQWILFKPATYAADWTILDVMRGWGAAGGEQVGAVDQVIHPNNLSAESPDNWMNVTSTGFQPEGSDGHSNQNGVTYIYIAIRRPMKTPEVGTEVFAVSDRPTAGDPDYISGFPVDMAFHKSTSGSESTASSRLQGERSMLFNNTSAEISWIYGTWDWMNGWSQGSGASSVNFGYMFKRAAGFMDVVCYTGTGAGRIVTHNLGVAPEMIWVKNRDSSYSWTVYAAPLGTSSWLYLETAGAASTANNPGFNAIGDTTFGIGSSVAVNGNTQGILAYLFATLAGVSKVGSYTGTGADLNVDCGFTASARFILIKRTDSTGDWYYWDSVRGISAGNDPYLLLNTMAAQVTGTNYVESLNAGFTVTSSASSTVNINGGTYIFLAIA